MISTIYEIFGEFTEDKCTVSSVKTMQYALTYGALDVNRPIGHMYFCDEL